MILTSGRAAARGGCPPPERGDSVSVMRLNFRCIERHPRNAARCFCRTDDVLQRTVSRRRRPQWMPGLWEMYRPEHRKGCPDCQDSRFCSRPCQRQAADGTRERRRSVRRGQLLPCACVRLRSLLLWTSEKQAAPRDAPLTPLPSREPIPVFRSAHGHSVCIEAWTTPGLLKLPPFSFRSRTAAFTPAGRSCARSIIPPIHPTNNRPKVLWPVSSPTSSRPS